MRVSVRTRVGLLVVVLLSSTLVVLGQSPASADRRWQDAGFPSGVASKFWREDQISAAGPDEVWVLVAGTPWHWDGTSWQRRPVTAGPNRVLVAEISATADGVAWVSGRIELPSSEPERLWTGRWNGSSWTAFDPPQLAPSRVGKHVIDLEATDPDDVWLLFGSFARESEPHSVLHFDVTSWTQIKLRGPGCGYFQARGAVMTMRRGLPVVSGTCSGKPGSRFVWQLKDGRWAARGWIDDYGSRLLGWRLGARPGGAVVLVPPGHRGQLWVRTRSGEWNRQDAEDPGDLGEFLRRATDVDPTNGVLMSVGYQRPSGQAAVCARRNSGSVHCRYFRGWKLTLKDVDVDPVSGSRWVVGSGSDGVKVWSWR